MTLVRIGQPGRGSWAARRSAHFALFTSHLIISHPGNDFFDEPLRVAPSDARTRRGQYELGVEAHPRRRVAAAFAEPLEPSERTSAR